MYYNEYGGRGIYVCDEWLNVKNFINDMFPTYIEGLTLDRINNDFGYFKENCRWATQQEQTLNQERSVVNKFTSKELKTIKDFYHLASRFKERGVQLFSTNDIQRIFSLSSPTVTKILNEHYILIAKDKEDAAQKTSI